MDIKGKQVLVLGLGESGLAMARWLVREGARVRVADSRQDPPNVKALRAVSPDVDLVCGPFSNTIFCEIDLIALSPGIPFTTPEIQSALARGIPVISEIELFAWAVRRHFPHSRIIAITGSNGKTTTTALTAFLLNAAGIPAIACGNISPSALDALMGALDKTPGLPDQPSVWVAELSSFQLETTHTLNADAAALLNISEDHLDRYSGLDDYTAAKARIFEGATVMVLNRDDARSAACALKGRKTICFGLSPVTLEGDFGIDSGWIVCGKERIVALSSLAIAGLHNAANVMAALALCSGLGIPARTFAGILPSFKGLPHRVELVAVINGVSFFDDSKGTNVGATLAAIQGLGCKTVIILGGEGKEQDFSPLGAALDRHARAVALIGRDAPLIAAAIAQCRAPTRFCADLEDAVRWSAAMACSGDAVLLSPACASFDMFRNYAHRAEVFIDAVRRIEREVA